MAAALLEQPAQLQRWSCEGSILEDEEFIWPEMKVTCMYLLPSISVFVKVVSFTPPSESELISSACVQASPVMTISALKYIAGHQCGVQTGRQSKLFKHGCEMEDAQTLEAYQTDPEDCFHLIVPKRYAPEAKTQVSSFNFSSVAEGCRFLGIFDDREPDHANTHLLVENSLMVPIESETTQTTGIKLLRQLRAGSSRKQCTDSTEGMRNLDAKGPISTASTKRGAQEHPPGTDCKFLRDMSEGHRGCDLLSNVRDHDPAVPGKIKGTGYKGAKTRRLSTGLKRSVEFCGDSSNGDVCAVKSALNLAGVNHSLEVVSTRSGFAALIEDEAPKSSRHATHAHRRWSCQA